MSVYDCAGQYVILSLQLHTVSYCIGPDTPPDQFSSIPNAFDVLFMWEEPVVPNGIIVSYTITITNINTSVTTTNVIEELYFNLTGFKSYQSYVAFVTAATVVGDGPPAVTSGRTNLHSKEKVKESG